MTRTKYYFESVLLISALMGLLLAGDNAFILDPDVSKVLIGEVEEDAEKLSRHLLPEVLPWLEEKPGDATLDRSRRRLSLAAADLGIHKLRIFDSGGKIVFSSEGEELGRVNDKPYFRREIARGKAYSKLVEKDHATAEGEKVTTDVVETYVPILSAERFVGALEIYLDVTAKKSRIDAVFRKSSRFLLYATAGFLASLALIVIPARKTSVRREQAEGEIRKLAYYDPLTGLPNRTLYRARLEQAIFKARRREEPLALLYLNLERFKEINDALGHCVGDRLLREAARRLEKACSRNATVFRLVGDQFAVLAPSIGNEARAAGKAERLLAFLDEPFVLEGKEIFVASSAGITLYPRDGEDAATLRMHTDLAMHAAGARRETRYLFFSEEMGRNLRERRELEEGLRCALPGNQFHLVFQPQMDLRTGVIVGAEALLRWRHPERGLIPPDRFIPVAEETGLIGPIGELVLRTASSRFEAWRKSGLPPLRMAVNLCSYNFNHPDFMTMLDRVVEETGIPPRCLELELTESMLMEDAESTVLKLAELKQRGFTLAIDDFGTGYSSLKYLKDFPVDRIKIDRGFVANLSKVANDATLVETIITMARSMDLEVTAEGVETEAQEAFLREMGCHEVQGFLYGRPRPEEEFVEFFRKNQPLKMGASPSQDSRFVA